MISNPFQIRRWAGEAIDFSGNIIAIAARMDFCNRCENVATIVPITINCDFYSRFSNLNRTSRHLQAKTPWNHARSTLQWSHKPSTIMRHASSISFKYNFSKISLLLTMSPSTVWMTKFNEVPESGGGGVWGYHKMGGWFQFQSAFMFQNRFWLLPSGTLVQRVRLEWFLIQSSLFVDPRLWFALFRKNWALTTALQWRWKLWLVSELGIPLRSYSHSYSDIDSIGERTTWLKIFKKKWWGSSEVCCDEWWVGS